MAEDSGLQGFIRWAMTPPRSYLVYLTALILVWLGSFLAGTLAPKKAPPAPPAQVIRPHN